MKNIKIEIQISKIFSNLVARCMNVDYLVELDFFEMFFWGFLLWEFDFFDIGGVTEVFELHDFGLEFLHGALEFGDMVDSLIDFVFAEFG